MGKGYAIETSLLHSSIFVLRVAFEWCQKFVSLELNSVTLNCTFKLCFEILHCYFRTNMSIKHFTSLCVKLLSQVWEANQPRVADYININVQQGIVTESAYVVGDVISLKSSFLTTAGQYTITYY